MFQPVQKQSNSSSDAMTRRYAATLEKKNSNLSNKQVAKDSSIIPNVSGQGIIGNHAQLVHSPNAHFDFGNIRINNNNAIQAKLKISHPSDIYEQEADRVAEEVVRAQETHLPSSTNVAETVQRKCSSCEDEEKIDRKPSSLASEYSPIPQETLQRRCSCSTSSNLIGECKECSNKRVLRRHAISQTDPGAEPSDVYGLITSSGQSLDRDTSTFMESRFGYDFSDVLVHTDEWATRSAKAVNALAYTAGHDIVFGKGQYMPTTTEGRKLLAHELTHVIQQGRATNRVHELSSLGDNGIHDAWKGGSSAEMDIGKHLTSSVSENEIAPGSVLQRVVGPCEDIIEIPHPKLRFNDRRPAVREAQNKLNLFDEQQRIAGNPRLRDAPLKPDCIFGQHTFNATVSFQELVFPDRIDLHTGNIFDLTWAELDKISGTPVSPVPPGPPPIQPEPGIIIPAIRDDNSPDGMFDRVTTDKPILIPIQFTGPKFPITLFIEGSGINDNGAALINDKSRFDISDDTTVLIRGTVLTKKDSGGALRLTAVGLGTKNIIGPIIAQSEPFSVSTIPTKASFTFEGTFVKESLNKKTGEVEALRGILVGFKWNPDSGHEEDLSFVDVIEQIEVKKKVGVFASFEPNVMQGPEPAFDPEDPFRDGHTIDKKLLPNKGEGDMETSQLWLFFDHVSESPGVPIEESGFTISRHARMIKDPSTGKDRFVLITKKKGEFTQAKGFHSEAGEGSVEKCQNLDDEGSECS